MDGSTGTNVHMIRATYDELVEEGFTLRYIVVTHPDIDHYGGINQVLGFNDVDLPQVLLTNRFSDEIKNKMLGEQYIPIVQSLTPIDWSPPYIENKCFNVSHSSFTSDLVLYRMRTADEQPIILKRNGTFKKPEKKKDNESSIITTITTKNDDNAILACLTGDAFFDTSEIAAQFLSDNKIIVFQVPHHGSKHNSNFEFYEQIAENTQYYLISCGHHGKHCFPDKDVFTSIRKATVEKNKKGATIVLTDGTNLNGEKVSSFTGHDHEPSISYWDLHLKRSNCELINKYFLQFTFSDKGILVDEPLQNLIQWSIEGYRQMTFNYGSKQRLCGMHLKTSNNHHLKVVKGVLITEKCQSDGCTASIDGHIGLPAPTDPCTWDNDKVIMVYGTDDLIFLQLATGGKIVKKTTYTDARAVLEKSYISDRKLTLRNADGYGKVVSHLIGALTDVIFGMKTTAAKKVEMINAIKIALKDKIGKFDDGKEATDSIMRLVKIANQVRADLNESKKYDQKIVNQRFLEIDTIKEGLSLSVPTSITSLDEEFIVFKCVDVPWQIAYGTINDNGDVNWGVLNNTLKTSTGTIPMTVFQG